MTANYVPQDMSNEIDKGSEAQKKSFATQRRLDETSNISTQRASEAFNLKGLQSSQLVERNKHAVEMEALKEEVNATKGEGIIPATPISVAPVLEKTNLGSPVGGHGHALLP